jgi:hypothetical protein
MEDAKTWLAALGKKKVWNNFVVSSRLTNGRPLQNIKTVKQLSMRNVSCEAFSSQYQNKFKI